MITKANASAWRCTVCGYIHEGAEPPDECPVCGAGRSDFEAFSALPAEAEKPRDNAWRCTVCGYEHEGPAPPDECPVCGAGADAFEAEKHGDRAGESAPGLHILIVGGGIAGVAAAEAARKASPESDITLISGEGLPYYRISLTRFLAGDVKEHDLPIHPETWYGEHRIRLVSGKACAVDAEQKTLAMSDPSTMAYDRLILACGARPFIPPIPGANRTGVFTLRTRDDAHRILDSARSDVRFVVVGGGILGLETAGALAQRGLDVALVEGHATLMPRQLPEPGAHIMARFVRDLGIDLHTGSYPASIEGSEVASAVRLENGNEIRADRVILATGVRSDLTLAQSAGANTASGVLVDDHLCTSRPGLYSAGDMAEHKGVLYGSWSAAQVQGKIAGLNAAGQAPAFAGLPRSHTLKVLGLGLVSVGQILPERPEDRVVEESAERVYRRFVIRDGCLAGAVLLGDIRLGPAATKAIEEGADAEAWLNDQAGG